MHRKTKRTQYSTPPEHRADLLAHRQSEWSYSWHTTKQRIQWLRRPTAHLLRLHRLNRTDNVREAPKASNAAEHTKHICSQPRPSLSKHFRYPTVGPVCSCLKVFLLRDGEGAATNTVNPRGTVSWAVLGRLKLHVVELHQWFSTGVATPWGGVERCRRGGARGRAGCEGLFPLDMRPLLRLRLASRADRFHFHFSLCKFPAGPLHCVSALYVFSALKLWQLTT